MKKYALMMNMPEGKLPGFYAQIVKALANKAVLFDRDKELLIMSTPEERNSTAEVLDRYHIDYEELGLYLLPEHASLAATADDYGFTSRSGNVYLYEHLVSFFRFTDSTASSQEAHQAYLQMEEHIVAGYTNHSTTLYAVDTTLQELIPGIAKAYGCSVEFVSG
jgi:hypothetical protein